MSQIEPDPPENPIVVPASVATTQVESTIRAFALAVGGAMAAKGVVDSSLVEPAVGLVLVVGPLLWSYVSNARKHRRAVTMANALDNSIAVVSK